MIAEIQCLPNPTGNADNKYAHIEPAIAVIESCGLTYEVDALGTTVEGTPDEVWALLRAVHEASLSSGAESAVTVIKVADSAPGREASTIESLTGKFRA
jgi:uncharacterized protein YqgV (UPF0045/DUF77 family)